MADWENKVQDAAARAESEVQRLIHYLNDEVVPDVRKQSSVALRAAAEQLQALAEKMDDRK
jgi:bisphosphoglycerate-dependent phosphoglycerate mutase